MMNEWRKTEIDYLYKTSHLAIIGTLGCILGTYYVLSSNRLPNIQFWTISAIIYNLLTYILWALIYKNKILTRATLTQKSFIYFLLLIPDWLHWTILNLYFYPQLDYESSFFVAIVMCGIASASIPIYLTNYRIITTSVLTTLVPFMIGCYISDKTFSYTLYLTTALYALILLKSGKVQYKSKFNEAQYLFRNNLLIEELKIKNSESIDKARSNVLIDMASGMSHEINNPLTTILLRTELLEIHLKNEELDKDKILKISDAIKKNAERIFDITKNLSYFFEKTKTAPVKVVALSSIFEELKNHFSTLLEDKNISLHEENINAPYKVLCDKNDVYEALKHVINNAVEACLLNKDKSWISFNLSEKNDNVQISIADNGVGIPEPIRDKIMNPFFTTKDTGDGLGLGLSIANSLIKKQKGSIKLDTEKIETTFVIHLPKAKE